MRGRRKGSPFSLEFEFYRNLFSVRTEPFFGRPNEIPMAADVCAEWFYRFIFFRAGIRGHGITFRPVKIVVHFCEELEGEEEEEEGGSPIGCVRGKNKR